MYIHVRLSDAIKNCFFFIYGWQSDLSLNLDFSGSINLT